MFLLCNCSYFNGHQDVKLDAAIVLLLLTELLSISIWNSRHYSTWRLKFQIVTGMDSLLRYHLPKSKLRLLPSVLPSLALVSALSILSTSPPNFNLVRTNQANEPKFASKRLLDNFLVYCCSFFLSLTPKVPDLMTHTCIKDKTEQHDNNCMT